MRSDLQQATPDRNGYRMRPVIGSQFVHQVLDMEVHGSLRNCQLIRNLLVAITIPNESKNVQLPLRKVVVTQVFGEPSRHVGRNMTPAGVNLSDHAQEFIFRPALLYLDRRSPSQ